MAFFLQDEGSVLPPPPQWEDERHIVPDDIRPYMVKKRIEVIEDLFIELLFHNKLVQLANV